MFSGKKIALIDLETTDPVVAQETKQAPQIIEVGVVVVDSSMREYTRWSSLVRPPDLEHVTPEITELTGITKSMLEISPSWSDIWRDFAKATNFKGNKLASWCSYFDIPILKNTYARNGLGWPHSFVCFCAMSHFHGMCSERGIYLPKFGLEAVCKQFGIDTTNNHRAIPDVDAMISLFKAFQESPTMSCQIVDF